MHHKTSKGPRYQGLNIHVLALSPLDDPEHPEHLQGKSILEVLLRAVPESTGPGVRVGRVRSSGGRGFSERVAAPTRLSCPGFSRGKGLTRGRRRVERKVKEATSVEWRYIFTAMLFDN